MLFRALMWLGLALCCASAALVAASGAANAAAQVEAPGWYQERRPPPPSYPNPNGWTERSLCELSNEALALVYRTPARVGVAVADLVSGRVWVGGDAEPFALHSVAKGPIAWLTLATAEARGEPLSRELADELRQMIAWSKNDAVPLMLDYVGGLAALRGMYAALRLEEMAANFSRFSWGRGEGRAADVAATYAQLAVSGAFSEPVREGGFALLEGVVSGQRWGAWSPPRGLRGWSALVKTGQFAEPEEGLRLNSAAIWLDQWRQPRYVVAIMAAEHRHWGVAIARQNTIGQAIGEAIQARERGVVDPRSVCGGRVVGG